MGGCGGGSLTRKPRILLSFFVLICLLDIYVKISDKLDVQISFREGLEIQIWKSTALKRYLKPRDWVRLFMEFVREWKGIQD